jgi:surface polysaccharide O-acyltransferase-like enzyme
MKLLEENNEIKGISKTPFLDYMTNFRSIAIIVIVSFHIKYLIVWDDNIFIKKVINLALMNCSVLFVFISGYLFQHLLPKFNFKSYLKKKFINVICPYLILSAPAVIAALVGFKHIPKPLFYNFEFINRSILADIVFLEITGRQWYHFWFIPMMIIFYVMAPVFRTFSYRPILYICIPFLITLSLIIGRDTNNQNPILSFLYFLPVYLIGSLSSQFAKDLENILFKFWYILVVLFFVLSFYIIKYNINALSMLQKLSLCYLLLYIMLKFGNKRIHILEKIANYSFTIYLIHAYVIFILSGFISYLKLDYLKSHGMYSFIGFCFIVLFLSYLIIWIIKKFFPHRSRLIVGC